MNPEVDPQLVQLLTMIEEYGTKGIPVAENKLYFDSTRVLTLEDTIYESHRLFEMFVRDGEIQLRSDQFYLIKTFDNCQEILNWLRDYSEFSLGQCSIIVTDYCVSDADGKYFRNTLQEVKNFIAANQKNKNESNNDNPRIA